MQRYCTTVKRPTIPEDDRRSLLAVDQYRLERQELNQLDVLEEYRLAELARAGSEDAKNALIESCLGYVYSLAVHYASTHPEAIDPMDLAQVGNEEMVRQFLSALHARNVCAFLRVVARHAISDAWIEDRLIRVPATSYSRGGRRAPLTVSLMAPVRGCKDLTLLDLLEDANFSEVAHV